MYDTSLLGAGSNGDGGSFMGSGGDATSGGGADTEAGSGGAAGDSDESGGMSSGGSASGGKAAGGATTGGATTGGTLTGSGGVPATGGAGTSGGTLGTGGARTGGAPATGGTTSTGGKGGTTSTGGKGGSGGTTSTGGSSGGATAGTTSGGSAGDGGCGTSDCCPTDPNKTAPGVCGCGIPDQDSATSAGCVGLRTALLHRYSFTGTGTRASDSVGTAHGTVMNTTLSDTGSLTLAGTTSDQYVDMPNGLISSLTNATIEVWLTWAGGTGTWQRIFDFGSNSSAEGTQDSAAKTYLFLTPKTGTGDRVLRATFSLNGTGNETTVEAPAALATGAVSHVSVVVNDSSDLLSLYLNGSLAESVAFTGHLSGINDINNWLGRSQFALDPEFGGALHEFRIYNAALSALQIQLTEQTGADPTFF